MQMYPCTRLRRAPGAGTVRQQHRHQIARLAFGAVKAGIGYAHGRFMERMQPDARRLSLFSPYLGDTGDILVHCHDKPRYAVQIPRRTAGKTHPAASCRVVHCWLAQQANPFFFKTLQALTALL
ncbi:hypothetical protein NGR_c12460 [Sinorhizobium fredii NGR234]|uniref:Uncharacterized protein n=1 Tax=Sinorhizobium fredii (strain NBRC 101917 / NGR234) TaxID=394 RepID=C3MB34_SINFN|nr:hypothetical protein NGR_c12460 [Sinorhizobium fredii NGR234]